MVTCRLGKPKVAKALLDHQADPEYQNKAGHSWLVAKLHFGILILCEMGSLMEACYYGHLTIVEILRERGASWLARDKAGLSPLHWAVDGGHIDVVQYILNDGMDVSSRK